eukprot:scaffold870_cov268-Pinguiococcus_pyrenoidosus.AAC.38
MCMRTARRTCGDGLLGRSAALAHGQDVHVQALALPHLAPPALGHRQDIRVSTGVLLSALWPHHQLLFRHGIRAQGHRNAPQEYPRRRVGLTSVEELSLGTEVAKNAHLCACGP